MKKKMRIWHLFPIKHDSFVKKYTESQTWSAVVVAKTEKKARKVAAEAGGKAWLDERETHCAELVAKDFEVAALISDEPPWGFSATPWKKCHHQEKFDNAQHQLSARSHESEITSDSAAMDLSDPQPGRLDDATHHLVQRPEDSGSTTIIVPGRYQPFRRSADDTTGAADPAATDVRLPDFVKDNKSGIMVRRTL